MEATKLIESLDSAEIRSRIEALEAEQKALGVLLRAALACVVPDRKYNNAGASVGTVQIINNCGTIMQFNQMNENPRDVNNAISEKGDVIQTAGTHNTVQTEARKESFWETLWSKIKACWKWLRG